MKKIVRLFGVKLSTRSMRESIAWITSRIRSGKGGVVYCSTLNEMQMCEEDISIRKMYEEADLITADGMPLVWGQKIKTGRGERVYGPDLMIEVFKSDNNKKLRHFFLGSSLKNLKKIKAKIINDYGYKKENLGIYSPEFKDEFNDKDYKKFKLNIEEFKTDIVWVGMGAEKQIIMANKLNSMTKGKVFITVGAAFDFLAGNKRQAPKWMRDVGAEWFYRLITEPTRLFGRYFKVGCFLVKTFWRKLR